MAQGTGVAPGDAATNADRAARLRNRAAALLAQLFLGRFLRLYAALFIAVGALLLTVGWQAAPQQMLDARAYAKLTARAEGRIVESWLAVQWDPAEMGQLTTWHPFATTAPCAVVEYGGDWGSIGRKAFCGNKLRWREESTLHDLDRMAPEVPFEWARDAAGFVVPEIRLPRSNLDWLAAHPPASTFRLGRPAPASALEALQRQLDQPVEAAMAGWARPWRGIALAVDPDDPSNAMPAAYVASRLSIHGLPWVLAIVFGVAGLATWVGGFRIMMPGVPAGARAVLALLPLATLPWWSERFPDALRPANRDLAAVMADMFGDIDRTGRLVATDPAAAAQAGGARLRFGVADSGYQDTFGRFAFRLPDPAPRDGDAALAALGAQARAGATALPEAAQIELLHQLVADKKDERAGAGLAFVPWALSALTDPAVSPAVALAARHFLVEWTTQPIDEPWPEQPGFGERVRIYEALGRAPVPVIANMAHGVVERTRAHR